MWPEVIAVLSAMGWAGDAVLVRIGARTSNVIAAAFLSYAFAALLLWIYLFVYFFPLGAAFCGAVSQNLRKSGLLILPDPYAGAAISASTSLVIFSLFLVVTGKIRLARERRESLPFFGSAALVSASAQILNFAALNGGEVSAMVPLLNTTPLFTVVFSALFLREVETVTLRVVHGALLMVAGVIVIAVR